MYENFLYALDINVLFQNLNYIIRTAILEFKFSSLIISTK